MLPQMTTLFTLVDPTRTQVPLFTLTATEISINGTPLGSPVRVDKGVDVNLSFAYSVDRDDPCQTCIYQWVIGMATTTSTIFVQCITSFSASSNPLPQGTQEAEYHLSGTRNARYILCGILIVG
jgi:hypothetical protein